MKWALLAVAVFVCAFALFAAVPRPVMLGVFDAAGHSFGAFVNVVGRVADWATGQVDRADTPAGSRRTETFAADLSDRARVIDGDTIELGAARVRLHGVDAPESAQSCLAYSAAIWMRAARQSG